MLRKGNNSCTKAYQKALWEKFETKYMYCTNVLFKVHLNPEYSKTKVKWPFVTSKKDFFSLITKFIAFLTPKLKWGDCTSLYFWNCTHWVQHESIDPIPYGEDNHRGTAVQGIPSPHQLPPTLQGVLLCSGTIIFLQGQGRSLI